MDSKALRKRIFYGGVEHSIRKQVGVQQHLWTLLVFHPGFLFSTILQYSQVWKFLLGYHPYDSTYAEREYLASVKKSEYEIIKSQWQVRSDYIAFLIFSSYILLSLNSISCFFVVHFIVPVMSSCTRLIYTCQLICWRLCFSLRNQQNGVIVSGVSGFFYAVDESRCR